MSSYKTLHKFGVDEYIVEKSTFIGYAKPIKTEEEAIEFVNEIKKKHKDATHNVWAYTVGENIVRAYTKGAKVGIEAGIVIEKVKYTEVKIKIEYTQLGKIQNEIMNLGFTVKDTIYSDDVEIIVYSKVEDVESLKDRIIDITSGTADVSLGDEYYLSEKDGQLIL